MLSQTRGWTRNARRSFREFVWRLEEKKLAVVSIRGLLNHARTEMGVLGELPNRQNWRHWQPQFISHDADRFFIAGERLQPFLDNDSESVGVLNTPAVGFKLG